jgi:hypothetical protein
MKGRGLEIFEEGGAATLRCLGEKWRVSGDGGDESAVGADLSRCAP